MVIRRGRTSGPPCVAVTGASVGLGRALVERLALRPDLPRLVGLDEVEVAGQVGLVQWRTGATPMHERLAGVTTVVHLAMSFDTLAPAPARRALNVTGTAQLLEAALQAGVSRIVLLSSVDVYGASAQIPVPVGAPLLAAPDDSLTGDLVELERLADHAGRAGLELVILRPATVVGGRFGPAYDGALLRSLSTGRLLSVRGVEPLWQLCHVDDLLAALELAAVGAISGVVAVACDGWLTQREVERLSGRRRLELPAAVALSTAERLHRIGATSGSPRELDRLLSPLVVDAAPLRAIGWTSAWTNAGALAAHLEARPGVPGRAGTYTAAGASATVALLGTAALVRRARARRGR